DPGMVHRSLNRKIQRNLEAIVMRGAYHPAEVIQRTELGMDRRVPALFRADRVRASRIIRRGRQAVVAPLAVGTADRMYRCKIEDVEAEITDVGEAPYDVIEAAA